MAGIDWAGLMRAGLGPPAMGGLGLRPAEFWALSPVELQIMLGVTAAAAPVGRARLAALMAAYPDQQKGAEDDRDRHAGRSAGGVGGDAGQFGRHDGGL